MIRPRILHLIHHLRIGGAETLLVELLPRLAEAGFEVHVACLDDRGPLFAELQRRGIPAHFIGRKRGFDPAALWRLVRLLRDLRIDILNTHSFSAGLWGRIAAVLVRTPHVVTTVHTVAGWSQPLKQRIGNRLLQPFTDRIVAVSESVQRSLIRQGLPHDAIQVIYNGIRIEGFRRSTSVAGDRKRLGLNPDGPLIGLIGRCSPEKGGSDWVQMMACLARRDARVQGVLVGNGPEQASWRALATAEGVGDRMRFVGIKTDIVPWLAVMDVLVCPSFQEAFGIAALEAQAAGVPVVATRVDGFLEALHDGEDALLVEPGNAAGMAVAVQSLLASNDLAGKLADGGRRNVGRFGINNTAQQYAALYWKLLGEQNLKS